MEVVKKYKVYQLNNIMGSSKHKSLEEVELKGCKSNNFETEEDAIQAILNDKKVYEDYIILKTIFIHYD